MQRTLLCVAALWLAGVSDATATIETYPDRAAWTAAAGAPTGGENFNGFTEDTNVELGNVPIQGAIITADDAPGPFVGFNWIDVPPFRNNSVYSVDGTPVLQVEYRDTHSFYINFTTPVKAWAGDFRRGQLPGTRPDFVSHIDIYSAADTLLGTIALTRDHARSELQFKGFTILDGAASRMVFSTTDSFPNEIFGLDNIEFVAVPEPASLIVAAWGILALSLFRRS
jgi:hypothetical protein